MEDSYVVSLAFSRPRHLSLHLPTLDGSGLLTGVLYLVSFAFGFASFTDPDYWWHLRTGEIIVDTLSIPRHDTYSFTAAGAGLLNHQWLSEALIYLSVSSFGYAVTLGLFIALTLASFGLMQRLLLRLGTPPMIALGLVGLGMLISAPFWTVRPQLLSWFLLAIFINVLIDRDRPAWLLVPVLVLWANLHLGFLLGLGIVGLWFLSRAWEARSGKIRFALWPAAAFVGACVAATLLNANGPRPLLQILEYLPLTSSDVSVQGISELESPDFGQGIHLPLLAGILVLVGVTLAGRVRDRFAVLLAIAFTAMALQTIRFQPLFALAFLPAAGLAATQLLSHRKRDGEAPRSFVNWSLVAITAVAILIAIPQLPGAQIGRQANTDGRTFYPAESLAWVQENLPDANVFTTHMWGGYFIYGLDPEGHVYIDGRSSMYGPERFESYRIILNANEGWQAELEGSGANVVVVGQTEKVASALVDAEGWRLVLQEPGEALFVRDP